MTRSRLYVNEADARQILLAQVIDSRESGVPLTDEQRDQFDKHAQDASRDAGRAGLAIGAAVRARANRVIETASENEKWIGALQRVPPWRDALVRGLPTLAFIAGLTSDIVANPRSIELVSLPLLSVLAWNILVYVAMLMAVFFRPEPLESRLRRYAKALSRFGRFRATRKAKTLEAYGVAWTSASARLNAARLSLALHLAAIAWAAGVALSIFGRGYFTEYQIYWFGNMWLAPEVVEKVLGFLFFPAVKLLGVPPFSLAEIMSAHFKNGAAATLETAQHWVFLYLGSLLIVVVIPRIGLAFLAAARERYFETRIEIDLEQDYFRNLLDRLAASELRIAVRSHRPADRVAIHHILHRGDALPESRTLIETQMGDVLREWGPAPAVAVAAPEHGWWKRMLAHALPLDPEADSAGVPGGPDLVLHVIADATDIEVGEESVSASQTPRLLLVRGSASGDLMRSAQRRMSHDTAVKEAISFDDFARCWVQESKLVDAIASHAPTPKRPGASRIVAAWDARNVARFRRAMTMLADALVLAARERKELSTLSWADRISKDRRATHAAAAAAAHAEVQARIREADEHMRRELATLHPVDAVSQEAVHRGLEVVVDTHRSVDPLQAGLAGAASGASLGAGVDLMTGGLTLGVAALLSGTVLGGAALAGAMWNNRKTPSGADLVQLSDEAMNALTSAYLLRYLALIHLGPGNATTEVDALRPAWNAAVCKVIAGHRNALAAFWAAARQSEGPSDVKPVVAELMSIGHEVLGQLYPQSRLPTL